MMDWLKDITIDDMPNEDMRLVAETCGLPVAVKLLKSLGGTKLGIPRFGFKRLIDRKIVEEFNGGNVRRLCSGYGVSRRYIYNVLRKHRKARRADIPPAEGERFFDAAFRTGLNRLQFPIKQVENTLQGP